MSLPQDDLSSFPIYLRRSRSVSQTEFRVGSIRFYLTNFSFTPWERRETRWVSSTGLVSTGSPPTVPRWTPVTRQTVPTPSSLNGEKEVLGSVSEVTRESCSFWDVLGLGLATLSRPHGPLKLCPHDGGEDGPHTDVSSERLPFLASRT